MAYYRSGGGVLRAPGLILTGTAGPDTLTGGADDDLIQGLDGDDTLSGLGGDDVLDGGHGADRMEGGTGDDAYWVDAAGDQVVEAAGQGFDTIRTSVNYTLPGHVENLFLIGVITGTGNDQANLISGDGARHTIYGMGGDDVIVGGSAGDTMAGGTGNDAYWVTSGDIVVELAGEGFDTVASDEDYRLSDNVEQLILLPGAISGYGNEQANILVGHDGDNRLDGEGGDDWMIGGLGDDWYTVEQTGDVVVELPGEGNDWITCYATSYVIPDNVEFLNMVVDGSTAAGNAADNRIQGTGSGTILFGLDGNDSLALFATGGAMIGGRGADSYEVYGGGTVVVELAGEGFDTVASYTASYALGDNIEQLVLVRETLATSGTGNAQDNILIGNERNNVLAGLGGNDRLTGSNGADRFVMGPGAGADVITDFGFDGQEALDVSSYIGASITWTTTQVGADTLVSFANGDQVTLLNFLATQLHQSGGDLLS